MLCELVNEETDLERKRESDSQLFLPLSPKFSSLSLSLSPKLPLSETRSGWEKENCVTLKYIFEKEKEGGGEEEKYQNMKEEKLEEREREREK